MINQKSDEAIQMTIAQSQWLPALSIGDVIARRNLMVEFVKAAMKQNTDFGVIPGTNKPTLLKPGAEKLCTLFGFSPHFTIVESEKDWTGAQHGGELFFYFCYRARLYRGEALIAESDGSCSSMEKKYRYRSAERICPICGKPTIIKGKAEYGGGWLCFAKKGGCGTKFGDNEPSIVEQQTGQVLNLDIADQVNTIQKMAQKRALIAATLLAVNASEFFTQDIEDMMIDSVATVIAPHPASPDDFMSGIVPAPKGDRAKMATAHISIDPATMFWTFANERGIAKDVASAAISKHNGDFDTARKSLEAIPTNGGAGK